MERIPTIVKLPPSASLWKSDPFLPVDWRAQDANRLVARRKASWADARDPQVREYVTFLRSGTAGSSCTCRLTPARQATIAAAHRFAHRNDPLQWLLEAAVLSGESDAQVAVRCGIADDIVGTYEKLFFAVREDLQAEGWILTQAIGRGVWQGFRDDDLSRLWRAFAYFGGPLVLDTLAKHFFAAWRPGSPATISVYFSGESKATLELRAAMATRAIPMTQRTGTALMHIHARLMEVEKTICGTDGKAAVLEHLIGGFRQLHRPDGPIALDVYLRPGAALRVQALVASAVLPNDGTMSEVWTEINLRRLEAEAAPDFDRRAFLMERVQEYHVRCAKACLAGKPPPKFRRPRAQSTREDAGKEARKAPGSRGAMATAPLFQAILSDLG